jgi:hypothetical protein
MHTQAWCASPVATYRGLEGIDVQPANRLCCDCHVELLLPRQHLAIEDYGACSCTKGIDHDVYRQENACDNQCHAATAPLLQDWSLFLNSMPMESSCIITECLLYPARFSRLELTQVAELVLEHVLPCAAVGH